MFRKLVKYEWTAMIRSMGPIYLAVLAVTILNTFMFHVIKPYMNQPRGIFFPLMDFTPYLTGTLYAVVLGVMAVFTVTIIIQRFYKGLLKDEGYLMFTLPVESWKLILSKAFVSVVMEMIFSSF